MEGSGERTTRSVEGRVLRASALAVFLFFHKCSMCSSPNDRCRFFLVVIGVCEQTLLSLRNCQLRSNPARARLSRPAALSPRSPALPPVWTFPPSARAVSTLPAPCRLPVWWYSSTPRDTMQSTTDDEHPRQRHLRETPTGAKDILGPACICKPSRREGARENSPVWPDQLILSPLPPPRFPLSHSSFFFLASLLPTFPLNSSSVCLFPLSSLSTDFES